MLINCKHTLFSLSLEGFVSFLGMGARIFREIWAKQAFLARLLILIKKGGLLQLKFGVVGVNIYLWAQ